MDVLNDLAGAIHHAVSAQLAQWTVEHEHRHARLPTRAETATWVETATHNEVERFEQRRITAGRSTLSDADRTRIVDAVHSRMFGYGPLDELLRDPEVENIVANGHNHVTVTRSGGRREPGPALADSDEELEQLVRRIAATAGRTERRFDDAHPWVDVRLPDGSRLHAIKGVTSRTTVSIRKHRYKNVTLGHLMELGTLDLDLADTLAAAIRGPQPCSMIIAGGTDTGKTTFARALINEIPFGERLVIIEDNAELGLEQDPARAPHVVEMEVRQPNMEGAGGIGMDTLGRQALRMRPDRLIVGECRSGHEVRTMLDALNSGHEGSLTTIHADSSQSALTKMQTYALTGDDALTMEASAHLISLVVHLVVHLRKLPDGRRVVGSVREVTGAHGNTLQSNEVWAPDSAGMAVPTAAGFTAATARRLSASGWYPTMREVVA